MHTLMRGILGREVRLTENREYPAAILAKLSSMMFDLMRIAEQIEAHELSGRSQKRPEPRTARNYADFENVVPFRSRRELRREVR